MTYDQAFDCAVQRNAETGVRYKIYQFIWDGEYRAVSYHLPSLKYAVLVGEVGRRTPR